MEDETPLLEETLDLYVTPTSPMSTTRRGSSGCLDRGCRVPSAAWMARSSRTSHGVEWSPHHSSLVYATTRPGPTGGQPGNVVTRGC